MLTIKEFQELDFERKCEVVTFDMNYMSHRSIGNLRIFLYDAGDFFVEVFYSNAEHKVIGFNAFNSSRNLEPYLDKISLDGLWT